MKNNNFLRKVAKFLKNKNTVTILGVLACILILYVAYNYRVKQAINPVLVPVAKVDIQPRTLITEDMVEYIQVPPAMINSNVIRDKVNIVNYYSNYNTLIPAGSMFFGSAVISKAELPDAAFIEVPEDKVLFNLPVTMATTYGNAMMPGGYIDLYFKGRNEQGDIMVGKLLSNIKILAVKDGAGKNVFETTEEERTPAYLFFAVDPDVHLLLRKCMYLSSISVELIPVPNTVNFTDSEAKEEVSSQYLVEYINAMTAFVPEDELNDTTVTPGDNTTKDNSTTTTGDKKNE